MNQTENKTDQARDQAKAQRKRYMDGELSHQEYYIWMAEFIGAGRWLVPFTQEQIDNSTDYHLNDLPMPIWDAGDINVRRLAYAKGLAWSQCETVCVLKALARS